jgi:arylsulfatase A-like enzyme
MNMRHRTRNFILLILASPAVALAAVVPAGLQVENLTNPLGLDAAQPRLSWRFACRDDVPRDWTQSAYRILVASSVEKLARNEGDLWDSGKIVSDRTLGIRFGGKSLECRTRCWWKVQVWDGDGKASAWSEPASFSTGLMKPSDWSAQWITDKADYPLIPPVAGALTALEATPDANKWMEVDLGVAAALDRVVMVPAIHFERLYNKVKSPSLFPKSFRIVAATKPDFSDQRVLAEKKDVSLEWGDRFEVEGDGQAARFVRIEIERLGFNQLPFFEFKGKVVHGAALSELEVWSGGRNMALNQPVKMSDSVHAQPEADLMKLAKFRNLTNVRNGWRSEFLTDGKTEPVMGRTVLRQRPSPLFRKTFEVGKPMEHAVLHVTSLGSYEAWINGQRVGDSWLTPNWNDFNKEVMVQSYDVTDLLADGENVLSALLADGQYRTRTAMDNSGANQYYAAGVFGDAIPRLRMQLEITRADGSVEVVGTDASWKVWRDGPVQRTSIFDGVNYDARKELPGWKTAGFNDTGWTPAVESVPGWPVKLIAERLEPIEVLYRLKPEKVTEVKPGIFVVDFGRGIAGVCDLKLRGGRPGAEVTLTHGQILGDDGTVYKGNLWGAVPVDRITLSDAETVEPHFPGIYHGFRFVQIEGLESRDDLLEIEALALASAAPRAAQFECSDPVLNELFEMGYWTFRANMPGLVADCGGRDERLPWLGDCFTDKSATFAKYFQGLAFLENEGLTIFQSQGPEGQGNVTAIGRGGNYNPGWSDGLIWVPYHAMLYYGSRELPENHWDGLERFIGYIGTISTDGVVDRYGFVPFGDWLASAVTVRPGATEWAQRGPATVTHEAWGTLWYFHSTKAVARMARQLGRDADAKKYEELAERISNGFVKRFVKPDGTIDNGHQSAYALALDWGILPEGVMREKALQRLVDSIHAYDGHFQTGSFTTPPLLRVLSGNGMQDLALQVAIHREPPSYRAMVEHADRTTRTIWERFDTFLPQLGGPKPEIMNDATHVGLSGISDWMFETVGGLRPDPKHPGFSHFFFEPTPGGGIDRASGSYDSIRGLIAFSWQRADDGALNAELSVPPNTTATVKLPRPDGSVKEVKVGSGRHRVETSGADVLSRSAKPAGKRPNVLFLLVDDLGYGDLGCYGNPFHETPNIDALRSQGMKFTQAYSASPVCSPSRAAILTGKNPGRLHLSDWIPGYNVLYDKLAIPDWKMEMDHAETTLAEAFREGGYRTAFFGKWHLMPVFDKSRFEEHYPTAHGFDINIGGCGYGAPWGRGGWFPPHDLPNLPEGPEGQYLTDRLTDEAIGYLDRKSDDPFFLYLSYYVVHTPIIGPSQETARFRKKLDEHPELKNAIRPQAAYAAMHSALDDSVGRIVNKLKELGEYENTIIVLTSDNGGHFHETCGGLRGSKHTPFEGGLRVPALVVWPGEVEPDSVSEEPIISMDFYPTLLEAAGLSARPKQHLDGKSFLPVLRGTGGMERDTLYWHYPHYVHMHHLSTTPCSVVREGDWKLIEQFEDDSLMLFNLKEDPQEQHDLATQHPEKARQLLDRLQAWQQNVGAQVPRPNPDFDPAGPHRVTPRPENWIQYRPWLENLIK